MDFSNIEDYYWTGFKILASILFVVNFKRILSVFRGSNSIMDKKEFAAMVFLALFIYMIKEEGGDAESQSYSDWIYMTVASMTLASLGFDKALETFRDIVVAWKGVSLDKKEKEEIISSTITEV